MAAPWRIVHDHDAWDASAYATMLETLQPAMACLDEAMLDAVGAGPRMRILDVACGPGHTTAAACDRGCDAVGLDADEGMLELARQRWPEARFMHGDMRSPPAGPWDAIVCRMGAHHVDEGWIAAARAVLRPGGALAITEMDGRNGRDENGMRDAQAWVDAFCAAGFVSVHATPLATEFAAAIARLPADAQGEVPMEDGAAYLVVGRANP